MTQNPSGRQRVRRIDTLLILTAMLTAGAASVLFWWASLRADSQDVPTPTPTYTITASPTITLSPTHTPTWTPSPTATDTPTRVPSATPTPTDTFTPSPTATNTATATATFTPSATHTPTYTHTPYPNPLVDPVALAGTYANAPINLTGNAQPGDTITLLDNGEPIMTVESQQSGRWQMRVRLSAGQHLLELYATSPSGEQSATIPIGFIVNDPPTPTASATLDLLPATATEVAQVLIPSETALLPVTTEVSQVQAPAETASPVSPSATASPITPTNTPAPPSATHTPQVPAATETPTQPDAPSQTPSATPSATPTSSPLPPLAAPRIDTPQNPYSPFALIIIAGSSAPNTRLSLSMGGVEIGEAQADASGRWVFSWTDDTRSGVVEVVASDGLGRSSPSARANIAVEATPPRIVNPISGRTINPGLSLTFSGTAPALAPLQLQDSSGVRASITADEVGAWSADLSFAETGNFDVQAVIVGAEISSNTVRVNVAEAFIPQTGANLHSEPDRVYTALLALMLTAGGFTLFFMGRALYVRTRA